MNAPTMSPRVAFFAQADMLSMKPNFERKQNDFGKESLFVSGVPIFRSGSFKDSMGELMSFDKFSIDTMINNFNYLKTSGVFPKPVVRRGHPSMFTNDRMQSVIGYINDLHTENRTAPHDGQNYDYLIAELEIIDDEAKGKIESGLWLNRSMEMGPYESNSGQETYPVVTGVAYVDVPAVEGLNFSKNFDANDPIDGILFNYTEDNMTGTPGVQMPTLDFNKHVFNIGQIETNDFSKVQDYITDLENKFASEQAKVTQFETENANLKAENMSLKEFQDSVTKDLRNNFVDELAKDGKILESAKDNMKAFASGLNDEQFESWKNTMNGVPTNSLFENHGNQEAGEHDSDKNKDQSEFQTEKNIITALKAAGKTADQIKVTSAYQRVIAAEPNFTI